MALVGLLLLLLLLSCEWAFHTQVLHIYILLPIGPQANVIVLHTLSIAMHLYSFLLVTCLLGDC